jgi:hypothetical protein
LTSCSAPVQWQLRLADIAAKNDDERRQTIETIERRFFEAAPYAYAGQYFPPIAYRKDRLRGVIGLAAPVYWEYGEVRRLGPLRSLARVLASSWPVRPLYPATSAARMATSLHLARLARAERFDYIIHGRCFLSDS